MYAISATPVGGGQAFIISDGTGRRGAGGKLFVNDFQCEFGAHVQRNAYLDAAQVMHVKPGAGFNQWARIPLEVQYEFASEGACLEFIKTVQRLCPVIADVTISAGGTSAVMANVCLRPLRVKTLGQVTVNIVYPIDGGLMI
jgi:hypothetical protein